MEPLTWADVGARRLERSFLSTPSDVARPEEVAAAMCGTHAQVMPAAEVSIAIRTTAGTREDVQAALWTDHRLIKTYGLRGTVHLFPARELPMWTSALAAVPPHHSGFPEGVRLTADESRQIVEGMAAALEDAELTNDELDAELATRVGQWAVERSMDAFQSKWPRWRLALYDAVTQGVACFGPNRGAKVTWTSVRQLVPDFQLANRDEAVRWLVRAYLRAYGPSTPAWFARWVAAPKRWADGAFGSVEGDIAEVDVEGTRAWLLADDRSFEAPPARGVRLLPYFDAFSIAWQPRELMFAGRAAERALANGQAGPMPLLLVDGTVQGIWRQEKSTKRLSITVEPFADLGPKQRQGLEAQVARLGEISGLPAELAIGEVTGAAHR
jgi:DNA glycosylase AlkZ-like